MFAPPHARAATLRLSSKEERSMSQTGQVFTQRSTGDDGQALWGTGTGSVVAMRPGCRRAATPPKTKRGGRSLARSSAFGVRAGRRRVRRGAGRRVGAPGDRLLADDDPGRAPLRGHPGAPSGARAGDRERVDRIGLARLASGAPGVGHHLRRHAYELLAGAQQVAFERPRQVPAVLDGHLRPGQRRPLERAQVPSLVASTVVWAKRRPTASVATI